MRAPIAVRLFLMVSLSFAGVALAGLALVRWKLADAPASDAASVGDEQALVNGLGDRLESYYVTRGDWGFLPEDPASRQRWLVGLVAHQAGEAPDAGGGWPTLAYRLVLTDASGHRLYGEQPSGGLVALAIIDRIRRPVVADGRTVGYLTVAKPRDAGEALVIAFLIQQQRNLALLAWVAAGLGALAAAIVATGFRWPLRALVHGARRLGAGHYGTRVAVRRNDELGELAETFNQLAGRLEEAEQSRRQWVADTSHELRTPLAVLRAQIDALQDGVRPLTRESVDVLATQVRSLGRLVDDLHGLARADLGARSYDMHTLDLGGLVREVWDGFAERFRQRGLATTMASLEPALSVHGDDERLRQVIANLLENTLRHTDPGGQAKLSCITDAQVLRIVLDDSAPGVPAPSIERLGERFFRVDASRSRAAGGAGLGLALSREIVEAHGGTLAFAASPLGGLRVVLTLPRAHA